jgi:hypothetical protein
MKNNDDKNIQNLVDRIMAETALESPSVDFTGKVMSEVLSAEKIKTSVYNPVISKKGWFFIFATIITLFAFLLFNMKSDATGLNFNFSIPSFEKILNLFPGFQVSPMTANVLLAATIMLFVQIFLLKNYLDKRFEK